MGLLDQILDDLKRRNAAAAPQAPQPEEYSLPGVVADRFQAGSVQALRNVGGGLSATGVALSSPTRVQSEKEYLEQRPSEQPRYKEALVKKTTQREDAGLDWTFDPQNASPSSLAQGASAVSQELEKPIVPIERRTVKKTPNEFNIFDRAGVKVAPALKAAGSAIIQKADKVLENNSQWELPEHLKGRGALETLYAPDVTFKDKMTVFLGALAENTPQMAASLAAPVVGAGVGSLAGPGGATAGLYAGLSVGMGSNFLMETGGVYNDLRAAHPEVAEDQLADTAIAHGVVASTLEMLPVTSLFNRIPGLKKALASGTVQELMQRPQLAKRIVTGLVGEGLSEGATEALQELSANVAKRVYDENQSLTQGMSESAFLGFVMGGVGSGATAMATQPSAVKQYQLSKLNEMSSAELRALADNPEALTKEGYDRSEVIQSMRLIINLESAGERQPRPVGIEPTKVEPRGAESEKKLRAADLPIEQLELLKAEPEKLKAYDTTPLVIDSLIKEKQGERDFITNYENLLSSAPTEAVRRGIESSFQGEYYKKLIEKQKGAPAQPEAVQPEAVQPEAVQPEAVQPEAVQPEAVKPEAVQPEAVQPEAVQPEAVQPEAVQPEAVQPVRSRVVASEAMSKEGALVSDWLKPFGEGKPIFLVDQKNLASEFEGLPNELREPMKKSLGSLNSKGVNGFAQETKKGFVLAAPKTKEGATAGVEAVTHLAHEVGHYLHKQYLNSAPESLQKEVHKEYERWKRKNKSVVGPNKSVRVRRSPFSLMFESIESFKDRTDKLVNTTLPTGQSMKEYESSFNEWFADEVAKALTSSEQSITQVEQYFKKIGEMFRTLLQKITGTDFMPTEIVRDFVLGGDFFIQRYSSGVQKRAIEAIVADNEKSSPPTIERYNPTTADEVLQKVFNKPMSIEEAERKFLTDTAPEDEVSMRVGGDDRFFSLTNELNKAVIKEFTRGARTQEVGTIEKLLSTPEYFSAKDHTAFQMQQIASKKVENSHIFRKRVEGDSLLVIESAKKQTPEEYSRAKDYLIKADQLQSGMRVREVNGQWNIINNSGKVIKSFNSEKDAVYGPDGLIAQEVLSLRKAGVSEDQIATIEAFRALTNRGFDLQVEELRRSGDTYKKQTGKELTLKDGNEEISIQEYLSRIGDLRGSYFPRLRQESAFVLRASGEGKTNILETYNAYLPKNLLGNKKVQEFKEVFNNLSIPYIRENPVGKRIKELEAQGYELITLNPSGKLPSTAVNTVELLAAMNNLIQHAFDTTQHTDSALSEEQIGKIESSFVGSIADALKIKGGHGSRKSRVDDLWEGYETDPLLAAAEYAQRVSSSAAMRDTAKKMILTFTGRETTWDQYKEEINPDAKYSEYLEYTKRNMISPTEQPGLYQAMKDYMEYILTPSTKVDAAISKLQALALMKFIGLRVSSSAINLTNMYIAVPPTIASHSGLGLVESIKHINSAAGKYSLYRLDRVSESSVVPEGLRSEIQKMATEKLTDADRAIFREIERRGWDEENFSSESQRVLQSKAGKAFQQTAEVMMYMFGATERANRAVTIFAAYKAHEQSQKAKGVSKPDQEFLYGLAHHTSNRAHGQYGEAAKPWLVQKYDLAAAPYTFKKYQHNFVLNMIEIGTKGFREGNYTGAAKNVSYMLLAPAIIAGPGASAMVKLAFAVLGKLTDSDDPEEDFYKWFEDTFGESSDAATRASRYGLAGLVGVNLKGSIALDNPIPTELSWSELGGAGFGVFKDFYDSAVHFSHKEWMKGAEKLSPNAIGSLFRATREATEGLTTEGYAPKYLGGEVVKANFADTVARSLSFNPTRLATITDKLWAEKQVKAEYTAQRVDIKRRINRYLLGGSKNREEWSALMGDIRQYNDRASATYGKYQNPIITDEWLETAIRSFYTPSASER